jgi:hypothetical protein
MAIKNDKNNRFQRKHVRAPLRSTCLYVDGEHVFKAKTLNVSEGGLLLSELPHIPDINALPMMMAMPVYPKLSTLTLEELKQVNVENLPRKILRVKSRLVRSYEGESNVDKVFINFIGCEFYYTSDEFQNYINEYVDTFARNTVYLLSLFESLNKRSEQLETLRIVAHILGYDRRMKVPLLRAKVLHDYQSLESI